MHFSPRRLVLTLALLLGLSPALFAADVQVFAAASLTDVLQAIAKDYEAKSGDHIRFNFAGSNVLARQIEQGAPAAIFISADEAQMKNVAKAGLVDAATQRDLLANTLVIIAPNDSTLANFQPVDFTKPEIKRIALADPRTVPAGVYSKAYLEKLGLWSKVEAKVIPTANVRAALAAVESGNAETGMVYKTDASMSKSAKVIFSVPQADGPKIVYPIALLKTSTGDDAAKKFLAYLESPAAGAVFVHYGFLTEK
jgi:molybdate transport system substrate-binding protein